MGAITRPGTASEVTAWPQDALRSGCPAVIALEITCGVSALPSPSSDGGLTARPEPGLGDPGQVLNPPVVDLKAIDTTVLTTAAALRSPPPFSPLAAPEAPPSSPLISGRLVNDSESGQPTSSLAQGTDPPPPGLPQDLEQLPSDPELGVIRVRNPLEDPELGILRIRQQPDLPALPDQETPPVAFLTARLSGVSSDNILLFVNDVGALTGGEFIRPAASLEFYPPLGPSTVLIGVVDFGLQRYINQPAFDYDDLRVRVGVRQGLSPRSYGQFTYTYQELTRPGESPSKFFENSAFSLTLGRRDPIVSGLVLDTFYQFQYNSADSFSLTDTGTVVTNFNRVLQQLGAYLGYTLSPQWQTGLTYQVNFLDYTVLDRYDTIQQLLGIVSYSFTPNVRFSLYGGWSFGSSSDPRVNVNDTLLGFTIEATAPLF